MINLKTLYMYLLLKKFLSVCVWWGEGAGGGGGWGGEGGEEKELKY